MTTIMRVYLTKEAELQSMVKRMERCDDYRPRWLGEGRAAVDNAKRYLQDLKALLEGHQTEGDA